LPRLNRKRQWAAFLELHRSGKKRPALPWQTKRGPGSLRTNVSPKIIFHFMATSLPKALSGFALDRAPGVRAFGRAIRRLRSRSPAGATSRGRRAVENECQTCGTDPPVGRTTGSATAEDLVADVSTGRKAARSVPAMTARCEARACVDGVLSRVKKVFGGRCRVSGTAAESGDDVADDVVNENVVTDEEENDQEDEERPDGDHVKLVDR
jgi:hypothetical protein